MYFSRFSLRSFIIVLMVTVSMTVVLLASEVYRELTFKNERQALAAVLKRDAEHQLSILDDMTIESATQIQRSEAFRQAYADKDRHKIEAHLDDQFHQYYITFGMLKLVQVYIYDLDFELVAQSTQGPRAAHKHDTLCGTMRNNAASREGADRLKIVSGLCSSDYRPFYAVIEPIGGLRPLGYVQVVTDPLYSFSDLENILGLPIQLMFRNGEHGYRSPLWQRNSHDAYLEEASTWVKGHEGSQILGISAQKDMSGFIAEAKSTRNQLMLAAGGISSIALLIALLLLEKTMMRPLRALADQAQKVRKDSRQLKVPLEVRANKEVNELVDVFNEMSADLAELYDRYEEIAFYDQLTTLPNRALFKDRLDQLILLNERGAEKFGVLLLDLDNFKEINDTLGHYAGDQLLCEIGERLNNVLRASSTLARVGTQGDTVSLISPTSEVELASVARLGGDEFAILLPHLSGVEDAVKVAERIDDVLTLPVDLEESSIAVAGTLGISMYPEHGKDSDTLLRCADVALYVAKQEQQDYVIYEVGHDNHSAEQLELKTELRYAIDNNEMSLYYQPKLNLKSGKVTSVEALARWDHPERDMLMPDLFIPLSEHKGLIGPLTDWVIKQAINQYREWRVKGHDISIAINLSSRVLYDLYLPNKIEQALAAQQVPASAICIEVTEESTIVDPDRARENLQRLSDLGIRLSIDDYGTGYSSLGYLKNLPVDEIKIDKTFVMEMEQSESDATIVRSTIELAHNLGYSVVAEGVESKAVLKMLENLGCDYAQGFYLSRPIPPDQLLDWLKETNLSKKG